MSFDNDFWYELGASALKLAQRNSRPDEIVKAMVCLLSPFLQGNNYTKFFKLFEAEGLHLTPVHFYAPIPDTRTLTNHLFEVDSELPGIEMNDALQLRFLAEYFPVFQAELEQIPHAPTGKPGQYYYDNDFFSGVDACVLYCMVRHFKPNLVIEVGSGYSTLLSGEAAQKNGHTEIICIEPYPPDILKNGTPRLKQLLPKPVQSIEPSFFAQLEAGDLLFIDSTHVSQIASDVNYLFLEILPRLKSGVIVHVHDIYLPRAGRRDWVMDQIRFWNEQYLLQAFLIMNEGFQVIFGNYYMALKYLDAVQRTFPHCPYWHGSSFWMRRVS